MSTQDFPILDGVAPSWADVQVKCEIFDGSLIDLKDIAAINTNSTVEFGNQMRSGRVIKRTTGSVTNEASMTLYAEGYQKMIRNIASVAARRDNQVRLSTVHFNLQILHTPNGSDEIYEMIIRGCKIAGRAKNGAEGTDADKVEVALNPIEIVDVVDGAEIVML